MNLHSVSVGGIKSYLYRNGEGKALTMIHGAAYNHRLWSRQFGPMSAVGEVYAVDLPGHGESSRFPPSHPVSVESYARHVHDLLANLGCSSTVLIGHSMGGAISIKYFLDYSREVKALILIGTGAKLGVSPLILEGLSSNYEWAIRDGLGQWSFSRATSREVVEDGIKEMLRCPQEIAIADFKACNGFDVRESISTIEVPTLVIVGDEDKLTPVKWSEYLHKNIKNSRMEIVKNAGHMVMLERPNEVNSAITSFVNEITQ